MGDDKWTSTADDFTFNTPQGDQIVSFTNDRHEVIGTPEPSVDEYISQDEDEMDDARHKDALDNSQKGLAQLVEYSWTDEAWNFGN